MKSTIKTVPSTFWSVKYTFKSKNYICNQICLGNLDIVLSIDNSVIDIVLFNLPLNLSYQTLLATGVQVANCDLNVPISCLYRW